MHFMSFHIDGREGTCGTEVFTGTAADATVLVDGGHQDGLSIVFVIHHLDGSCGTVAGAVAATDAIGEHYAVVFDPYGVADMDDGLLFFSDGFDSTGGTDLAAFGTFGTAIARLV